VDDLRKGLIVMGSNPLTDKQAEVAAREINRELEACLSRMGPTIYNLTIIQPGGPPPEDQLVRLIQAAVGHFAGSLVATCIGSAITPDVPEAEGGDAVRYAAAANQHKRLEVALFKVMMDAQSSASQILACKLDGFRDISTEAKVSKGEFHDLVRETLVKAAGKGAS
jgi:hypothetical protein